MGFQFGKNKKEHAGLFIDRESYQYISLMRSGDHYDVVKSFTGSLSEDLNLGGELDAELDVRLEKVFRDIVAEIGEIKVPVNIAIPPIVSLLRIVPLPEMGLAEARLAFRYDYERYFPFPVDEAIFDLAPIIYPLQGGEEEKRFLVASTRKALINAITNAANDQGIDVAAIEPAQIAIERAVTMKIPPCDAAVYVYAGRRNSVVLLSWKGNGIFYRSISDSLEDAPAFNVSDTDDDILKSGFVKEVRSSLQFALSQIRGFDPTEMYIFGGGSSEELCTRMKESIDIPSILLADPLSIHGIEFKDNIVPAGNWDIPIGLVLREL